MKTLRTFFFIAAVTFTFTSFAQHTKANKLIGLWQVNTSLVADAMQANYRFFQDGTFVYSFNSYDDRGRIRQAKGTYKLVNNQLTIVVRSRKELAGGDLIGGSAGFQKEELVLDGGKIIEVKQKDMTPINLVLKWISKDRVKGFEIQNNKYYLVSTDPHNQED